MLYVKLLITLPYDNVTKYKSKYIFVIFKTNCNKNATFLRNLTKKPSDILKMPDGNYQISNLKIRYNTLIIVRTEDLGCIHQDRVIGVVLICQEYPRRILDVIGCHLERSCLRCTISFASERSNQIGSNIQES